ncbi:MAG: HNH endonuclease [Deltaproteobacteria bacterium]|nr:HNH endonuclease [Deltaproteobacteria bacterium]
MSEGQIAEEQKRAVAERAKGYCEYCRCQARFSPDSFSVEHIMPRSRRGTAELSNLALSCQGCNNRKYTSVEALDPLTGEIAPLYHPRQQPWTDHFTWNPDYTLILGLTPTGRATIEKLQLNRAGVINLRRVLRSFGEHPLQGTEISRANR